MKNTQPKEFTFREIRYQDIKKIVGIKKKDNDDKFNEWFSYNYKMSESDNLFFNKLIKKNKLFLSSYSEDQLKSKFIIPLLYRVDYFFDDIKDWYEYPLSATVNGTLLKGRTDFMLAKGDKNPSTPYFFIQEFKPSKNISDPEDQLLAEMLVAIKLSNKNKFYGAYVIGQHWFFVVIEKLKNGDYEYFVSKSLDCLDFEHLTQIYINLQAVKELFCKD